MAFTPVTGSILDVRGLAHTREVAAYRHGGLFPVLATAPDGSAVAVLRGGAGHLGQAGRIDIIRSRDGGLSWTQPQIVANSDTDDRNPAFGASAHGTLVLSYHRTFAYDAEGNYAPVKNADPEADWPCETLVSRSTDSGLTWEEPALLQDLRLRSGSPYGKIFPAADGTLLMPIYAHPVRELGADPAEMRPGDSCSYLVRSRDDGKTWGDPSLITINSGEPGVMALPGGDILAVVRRETMGKTLWCTRSTDGGYTWNAPVQITGDMQHPADLLVLPNGDVLLTYGNRNQPPCRVEGRISRDGGRTWLPTLLAFSGNLRGYNRVSPYRVDLGYPSSTLSQGRGITMYYYHPVIPLTADIRTAGNPAYDQAGYLAVAVVWDPAELAAAVFDKVMG